MKKSYVAVLAFFALLAAFFSGPISPANAGPLSSDASLTGLSFGSQNYFDWWGRRDSTGIYPAFDSNLYSYQLATVADTVDVNAVLSDPLATMKVTFKGVTGTALSATPYQIFLEPESSLLDIEVTAQDGTTKKHYTVNISNQVMAAPELVSVSTDTASWIGGKPITVRMKNVNLSSGSIPGHTAANCYVYLLYTYVDPASGNTQANSTWFGWQQANPPTTDAEGITTLSGYTPNMPTGFSGSAKVSLQNNCDGLMRASNEWGAYMSAESSSVSTMTFSEPYSVTEIVSAGTITGLSQIEVKGPNLYPQSNIQLRLRDTATDVSLDFWGVMPDPTVKPKLHSWTGLANGYSRQPEFRSAGKKTLEVGYNNYDPTTDKWNFVVLSSKVVNWKPTLPSSVAFSPAKSDISGGKRVKVTGYNLCNLYTEPNFVEVKIDGKALTSVNLQYGDYCGSAWDQFGKPVQQWITGIVPEGTSTGIKTVTVDNGNGPIKVAATFTYGATPVISSISETSLAATGGSKIRLEGTNFGFSGSPTVTIGGKKSPKVILVSDSMVDVIVPFDLPLGAQPVTILSSSGGGANAVPASINVVAASQAPTVSNLSASAGVTSGGETVTISVANAGTPSTIGVMFGLNPAEVTRATASEVDVKVPAGSAGKVSVTVSTNLGQKVVSDAYTYTAIPAVKAVTPSSVAASASSADRTVTITGVGFGSSGTLKIGQLAEQAYTSTDSGTKISGIVIPNDVAGSLSILVTPNGASTPLAASVRVTKPNVTYLGTDQDLGIYNATCATDNWECIYGYGRSRPSFNKNGGEVLKLKGTGFGSSGTVQIGGQSVVPDSYTDTVILLVLPALPVGSYDVTVVPGSGLASETWSGAFTSVEDLSVAPLAIDGVAPTVANSRGDASYNFDPSQDASSIFEIVGRGFLGSDSGASTKVYQLDTWGDPRYESTERVKVTVLSITDTSITFSAVRSYNPVRWTGVAVQTNDNLTYVRHAIHYVGALPPSANISGSYGLCTKDAIGAFNPATVQVTGTGMFGSTGSVTLSGQPINTAALTWTADSVVIDFSKLQTDLTEHWGQKTLEFTPADTGLISRSFSWFCGVWAEVETKINGSTADLTVQAGSDFTVSANIPAAKRLNEVVPDVAWPTAGYQYQSAADHARTYTWTYGVHDGLPTYAGDWYVRANPNTATVLIDRGLYVGVSSSEVHVQINGTPIGFTPKLKGSTETSILYRGQLGDGTNDSNEDIEYTLDVPAGAPEITKVVWEYRNRACGQNNPEYGWSEGLPGNVAVVFNECGGDGTTTSSWDIRVKSFEMLKDGKDQAMFYLPTFNVFNLTIAKRALTIDKVTASKPYDGSVAIYLGALTVTGALDGETPTLQGNDGRNGYFADASVGENKPVYVAGSDGQTDFIQRIKLDGVFDWNYFLTNSELLVLGSITKANARLSLSATTQSLVMSVVEQSTITAYSIDTATGNAPIAESGASDVVVTVATPAICSISAELVVTALAPGDCIVQASQAGSTNYNAAVATSDPESTVESLTITVYAQPKKVSLITQDITIGEGETPSPTYEVIGLADGDGVDTVVFDYYDGVTKLDAAPTAPGRYTVVPSSANIVTTNLAAYDAAIEFVPGILIITTPPPTISGMAPTSGSEAGGETIVISGTNLSDVSSIKFGDVVIPNTGFTVNGDGTEITFSAPAGTGNVSVILIAGESELSLDYSYDPPVAAVNDVAPLSGFEAGGNLIVMTGSHLELVSEIKLGTSVIPNSALVRSQDGTTISFNAPAGTGKATLLITATSGSTSFVYTYSQAPTVVPTPDLALKLLNPNFGQKLSGQTVGMSAKDLKPGADYTLNMYSKKVPMVTGTVSPDGSINGSMVIPAKACVPPGLHRLILESVDEAGKKYRSTVYVVLGAKCALKAVIEQNEDLSWTMKGLLFDYQKWALTADSKATLKAVKYWMKTATRVKVSGFTETDGKGRTLMAINKLLAKKRAQVTVNQLKAQGLKAKFWVNPVGAKQPVSKVQSKNRRVELNIRF